MGYFKITYKGIRWMGGLRGVIRGVGIVKIIFVARILTPEQFGLFGIAAITLSLLETVTETGINIFLIQLKKNIDKYINTAWIVSIIRGILISVVIIILSPVIAYFFNEPNVLYLILLTSLVPFIKGFINPSIVKLQKELKFNYEFVLRTSIYVLDAVVVIVFALLTKSAASMVMGLIFAAIFELVLSFLFIKPTPKLKLEVPKAKEIINKGKWITGYGIFNYLFQNIDDLVVGKLLGTASLGIYQVSYKISTLTVSEIADVVHKVTFPVYIKISSDKVRLQIAFIKTLIISSLLMFLVGIIIFTFPNQIVVLLLGENWIEAVTVIKVLVYFGFLKGFMGIIQSLFLAEGRQKYITYTTLVMLTVLILIILPLTREYELVGVAYAVIISSIVGLILTLYFLSVVTGKNIKIFAQK